MITFIPNLDSLLWSFKTIKTFDTHEDLKAFVADHFNRFHSFVGKTDSACRPADVVLSDPISVKPFICWKNYRSVHVGGLTVGHCGE